MEKKKIDLEGRDYIYFEVCFENEEIVGVKPAEESGKNIFPVVYGGLVFLSESCDEFHNYAVILKNDKPISICYSEREAIQLCEILSVVENDDVCYCLVPVIDPQISSEF